jgi:uncharacterized FlaG/YvyC family protein
MHDAFINGNIGRPTAAVTPATTEAREGVETAEQRVDSAAPHLVDRLVGNPGREAYAVFTVDSETGLLSVRIIDAQTEETIRQIPSEDLVRFAQQTEAYLKAARRRAAA